MLEVPETVKGVEDEVEAKYKLLPEGSLASCCGNALIQLSGVSEEEYDRCDDNACDYGNKQNVLGDPCLTDLLVGVRPVVLVVCCLKILESVFVVTVT